VWQQRKEGWGNGKWKHDDDAKSGVKLREPEKKKKKVVTGKSKRVFCSV